MNTIRRIATIGLLSLALPAAAMAQDKPQPTSEPSTPATPPIQGSSAPTGNTPGLTVATVKMDGGVRASKLIGATVVGDNNQDVGTLSDLILDKQGQAVMGIISVGSVLGMGGKLVAEPYNQFQPGPGGKLTLPGANKDSLAKQPGFTYSDQ